MTVTVATAAATPAAGRLNRVSSSLDGGSLQKTRGAQGVAMEEDQQRRPTTEDKSDNSSSNNVSGRRTTQTTTAEEWRSGSFNGAARRG
ncbi:putative disheveled-associated activator of morphogenesis 1 [Sesbania bispinosa]|nr:putative disheveled-associated activator of morphogenesis 1 [Sesbania bispinosa]